MNGSFWVILVLKWWEVDLVVFGVEKLEGIFF